MAVSVEGVAPTTRTRHGGHDGGFVGEPPRQVRRISRLRTERPVRDAAVVYGAITTHTVTTATGALDFPYAAVFTRDEGTGNLVPAATETTVPGTDPTLPTLSGGTGPVWTAFTDRTERLEAETYRERDGSDGWLDDAIGDWMLCPLGRRGVFLVATTDGHSLSATKQNLAETWAASTRQALEQLARTRNLQDCDRELERQNERLSRLDRINRLIRSIGPAVASADTRAEIETTALSRDCSR
jgi:hypothetical protein